VDEGPQEGEGQDKRQQGAGRDSARVRESVR